MEKKYKVKNLPDHVVQEIQNTIENIYQVLAPLQEATDYQVFLNSLNYVYAHFLANMPFEKTESMESIKTYSDIGQKLALEMCECYSKE